MVLAWIEVAFFVFIGGWLVYAFIEAVIPMSTLITWLNANGGLAGWAQAVAAVLAIGAGAAGIAWQVERQATHTRNQAAADEVRAIGEIRELLHIAREFAGAALRAAQPQEGAGKWNIVNFVYMTRALDQFNTAAEAMKGQGLEKFQSGPLKYKFLTARSDFGDALAVIREVEPASDDPNGGEYVDKNWWGWLKRLEVAVERIDDAYKAFEARELELRQTLDLPAPSNPDAQLRALRPIRRPAAMPAQGASKPSDEKHH